MRVRGTSRAGGASPTKSTKRNTSEFTLGENASATAAPAPSGVERSGTVSAALLDAAEMLRDLERRKAAIENGQRSLDRLRELQAAILAGHIEPALARRLATLASEPKGSVEDPELQAILDEITLRVDLETKRIVRSSRRRRA